MNIEAIGATANTVVDLHKSVDNITEARRKKETDPEMDSPKKAQVPPEEFLKQVKALTEDGLYSVRFENDKRSGDMIVRVVDSESGEIIRQLPPEELLGLKERLDDLRGNIVDANA